MEHKVCVISFMSDTITFRKLLNQLLFLSLTAVLPSRELNEKTFSFLTFHHSVLSTAANQLNNSLRTIINLPDDFFPPSC